MSIKNINIVIVIVIIIIMIISYNIIVLHFGMHVHIIDSDISFDDVSGLFEFISKLYFSLVSNMI